MPRQTPLIALTVLALLLSGCSALTPTPQMVEVTRLVEVTRVTQPTPPAETPAPPPTSAPAAAPADPQMLFPADCVKRQEGIDYWLYDWRSLVTIGGCGFLAPSPDGKYLAYTILTCPDPEANTCGEAVKILSAGSDQPVTINYLPQKDKTWVIYLGWSADNWLVISHGRIDGGVGTYVLSEPFSPSSGPIENAKARLSGGLAEWNQPRNAFVTVGYTENPTCVNSFSGYDFISHQPFPDVTAELGLPNPEARIEPRQMHPMKWFEAGERLILLLVTPLEFDPAKNDNKFMPRITAQIRLAPEGPVVENLGSSPTEDFSFVPGVGDSGFMGQPAPYQAHYCNEGQ
jgi:hypothetical protein